MKASERQRVHERLMGQGVRLVDPQATYIDESKRMGAAGKETVRQSYLIPRLLRDYLALIEEVVLGV